ncbi:MFS transporter [Pseudonocardia nantongensis]|uniref:MFS transporter n=1 Tax=Pseudonocardia nantongensis TaxID=1181885 RepID=UPI00397E4A22
MATTTTQRRAWFIVGSSTLAMTLSVNALVLTPYGILIKPIGDEFGWSRSTVTAALSLYALTAALVMPLMGGLLDRYGFRKVVIPGVVISGILLCLLAVAPASIVVWFVLMGLLGIVTTPQNGVPYYKLAAQWLDRRRGLAMGIIGTGGAVGIALVPHYVGALLQWVDWRLAFLGLGALLLVVVLPLAGTVLREPRHHELPQPEGRHEVGDVPGMELREALRSPRFWQLFVAVLLMGSAIPGVMVQMTPLLTDRGVSVEAAIGIVSLMSVGTMLGRLVGGFVLDLVQAPLVAAIVFASPILGFLLLANGGFGFAVAGALLIGTALGAEGDIVSYMVSRYMGIKCFGQIYGIFMAVLAFGYAFGPFAFAVTYDVTGSYNPAFVAFGVGLAVSSALALTMGRYRYPPGAPATETPREEDAVELGPPSPRA